MQDNTKVNPNISD